jgi:radical SAM superfamily enzyme YgiQ (UPF0313 family)
MSTGVGDLPVTEGFEARAAEADSRPVLLIGFQYQGNLGLGYLAASLRRCGHTVEVLDVDCRPAEILAAARRLDPVLTGFSLIFQFYIRQIGALIRYLRDNGVDCHFTMGGHYPTLSYGQTLRTVPELDSVVRYEGELTLLELVDARSMPAVNGAISTASPTGANTNSSPLLHASCCQISICCRIRIATSNLSGSWAALSCPCWRRGCARTCSFCSIHNFYRTAPGKVVRTRRPAEVVRETDHALRAARRHDLPVSGRRLSAVRKSVATLG